MASGVDCSGPEGRSHAADQPDPDRQRPRRGPPVHPLRRGQPRASSAADLDAVLEPAPAGPAHRLFPDPARTSTPHAPGRAVRRARAGGTITLLDVATPGPGRLPRPAPGRPPADRRLRAQHRRGGADPRRDRPGPPGPRLPRHGRPAGRDHPAASAASSRSRTSCEVRLGVYPVAFVDGSGGGDAFNAGYIARPARRPPRARLPEARQRRRRELRPGRRHDRRRLHPRRGRGLPPAATSSRSSRSPDPDQISRITSATQPSSTRRTRARGGWPP